jgi:hypothetical protein
VGEGKPGLLGERAPLDDPTETHGICRTHLQQFLATLPSQSFPGVEMLIVVEPAETSLLDYLERRFAGVRGVRVIRDRRRGDRRAASPTDEPPPGDEARREQERRLRPDEPSPLGYTIFRFRPGEPGRGKINGAPP